MKILDCTLRDGGYYTNWDFNSDVVNSYISAMNNLPIDYLEIGYRNKPSETYIGKFGYSPISVLKHLRKNCSKKIAVMLNEKSTKPTDLTLLLEPIVGLVDMVRIAIDPSNFTRAIVLAKAVKKMGFEVGFNTMYMSEWYYYKGFFDQISQLNGVADLFCMVDSFGGITPSEIKNIFFTIRNKTNCPIGFHGHNNLELGLINAITAIECGVDYVDATILGMGRGAGNLNMELLLTYLNKKGLTVDFNVLGDVITAFQPLFEEHKWGTNLPYMISGANSIPQKEVMSWVTNRTYSFNSIVRALDNKRNNVKDNAHYPLFKNTKAQKTMIIGGGNSCIEHIEALHEFAYNNPQMPIIFVTARHVAFYKDLPNLKIYCLVGNEAKRLKTNLKEQDFNGYCLLAPYPRIMGTEVPDYAKLKTFELANISFTTSYPDSCTTVALEAAIKIGAKEVYITGYDGYRGGILSEKEMDLSNENRVLFEEFKINSKIEIYSLTPTLYKTLNIKSVYQYL